MKKIVLTILAFCGTMMAWAQNEVLSAVLHHDSDTKLFTGKNAFVEANAAAVDGDVITLSPGAFIEADITKSISVYGAGCENNNETGTQQTIFNGLRIGVSGQTLANVRIEGFWVGTITALGALDGFVLDKCRITSYMTLSTNSNTTISNCALFNIQSNSAITTNCLIKNCYISGPVNSFGSGSTIKIDHCIALNYVGKSTCTNSIFTSQNAFKNTSGATVTKCIINGYDDNNPDNNTFQDCYDVKSDIFTDENALLWSETNAFELQHPELWIGTDGQEVGIRYGWSKVPNSIAVKNVTTTISGDNLTVNYTK